MTKARLLGGAALITLGLGFAGAACGQTTTANSATVNAGYGRAAGQENRPVDVTLGDANGNVAVVNGLMRTTASSSVFAHASGGAMDSSSGVGGSALAIGNNLNVVVQGSNNIVVVTATQTNTGTVTATNTTNGKH